jgi:hypothetical protein
VGQIPDGCFAPTTGQMLVRRGLDGCRAINGLALRLNMAEFNRMRGVLPDTGGIPRRTRACTISSALWFRLRGQGNQKINRVLWLLDPEVPVQCRAFQPRSWLLSTGWSNHWPARWASRVGSQLPSYLMDRAGRPPPRISSKNPLLRRGTTGMFPSPTSISSGENVPFTAS